MHIISLVNCDNSPKNFKIHQLSIALLLKHYEIHAHSFWTTNPLDRDSLPAFDPRFDKNVPGTLKILSVLSHGSLGSVEFELHFDHFQVQNFALFMQFSTAAFRDLIHVRWYKQYFS